jgi:hypothetical protein
MHRRQGRNTVEPEFVHRKGQEKPKALGELLLEYGGLTCLPDAIEPSERLI